MTTTLPVIRINPSLDPAPFAAAFQRDGVVQIPIFLEPADAERVAGVLAGLTWNVVAPDETSETLVISPQVIQKFGEAQVRQFLQGALKRASRGFSFIHLSYALQDEYARDPTAPIHQATAFLQSRTFLDFGQAVIGSDQVDGVRVQASNYRPGDFLTLHDDSHKRDDRLAAFTLGFTRDWRPDWGGQLLFHDVEGQIERGFMPGFNVLTLFRVPRAHSVAPVAAYAATKRLSLTGWLVRDANPSA
ncbi:2OG-Fe(II) oxygenase family protein [Caulobacter henricii]|uniref:Proline hydroxylase n=1 Tax=Caulobacter henricii TaxID=69395 RepID=A0A0N7JHR7_9CAUL|nr:2OG-Fe(II) oxygenase family protein [Caulobacter henricii]ALL14146.1 proline hydroxylase [Caulobacter henricii]